MFGRDGRDIVVPKVKKNSVALLEAFSWKFGRFSDLPASVNQVARGGVRVLRNGPRLPHPHPRASPFSSDFPSSITDGAWCSR